MFLPRSKQEGKSDEEIQSSIVDKINQYEASLISGDININDTYIKREGVDWVGWKVRFMISLDKSDPDSNVDFSFDDKENNMGYAIKKCLNGPEFVSARLEYEGHKGPEGVFEFEIRVTRLFDKKIATKMEKDINELSETKKADCLRIINERFSLDETNSNDIFKSFTISNVKIIEPNPETYYTILIWAADNGYDTIVRELLKVTDQRIKELNHNSKLHHDAQSRTSSWIPSDALFVQQDPLLIRYKNFYSMALIVAAKSTKRDDEIIKVMNVLLQNNNVDVNHKNDDGNTALIEASFDGLNNRVSLLLSYQRVKRNITNKAGNTALMVAAYKNSPNADQVDTVITLLSDPKVNVNITNKYDDNCIRIVETMIGKMEGNDMVIQKISSLLNNKKRTKKGTTNGTTKGTIIQGIRKRIGL